MPGRGGRVGGGGSRGFRSGGFRAPRSSGGGSSGFRIGFGNRASRTSSSAAPDTDTSTPHHHVHPRPWLRRGGSAPFGGGWRLVGIIVGLLFLGMCACVGLGVLLQALGYS